MRIRRRDFLALAGAAAFGQSATAPDPIEEPQFPSRLHLFVWRNWELANTERIAQVLGTAPRNVLRLGASMGLPKKRRLSEDQLARLYITAIRQNWHLVPEEQIVELLGWDRERFRFTLKEDDFLDVKLGPKPRCEPLRYRPPSKAEIARAAAMKADIRRLFGAGIEETGERLFQFVRDLSDPALRPMRNAAAKPEDGAADLSDGWSVASDPGSRADAERFAGWMRDAMGARVTVGDGARRIRLTIDPGLDADFETRVQSDEIRVAGRDAAGVRRGLGRLRDEMESREGPFVRTGTVRESAVWNPRYIYSYFALYGDPLMEPERDPFPEAYLESLSRCGVNGVWMQAVLNTLAPSGRFPEFGKGWETRLRNLNALVERAGRFGVKVYLYLNEPRSMPAEFFEKYPGLRGAPYRGAYAMCTSTPEVREWLADSVAHVMKNVPGLGGFFTITMSENHTNCFSHGASWGLEAPAAPGCPRCSRRASWDTIAELVATLREGIRRNGSRAELISWDWGWGDALSEKLIPLLPRDTKFLSVSEWDAPVHRGGVDTRVGEYSISVVGPGPRATKNWERARAAGVPAMARASFNNTWEMSAVPYIPVVDLILEHCENLAKAGVAGVMASWTCGGYASPNLAAAMAYGFEPRRPREEILREVATRRYGAASAPDFVEAWRAFSRAFREFPYGVQIYTIPVQHGPANPLRLTRTGYRAGMILFPYDDYKGWSGKYPPRAAQAQLAEMARLWKEGLAAVERGVEKASAAKKRNAEFDAAIAWTCYRHFRSAADQMEFYLLRDGPPAPEARARMRAIVREEAELAREQFTTARRHSAIAYEASNHYYYTPLDLVEKALHCEWLAGQLA